MPSSSKSRTDTSAGAAHQLACKHVWIAGLSRPFPPLICASDTSTEVDFGFAVARVPVNVVRRIARAAERQGDYVVRGGGGSRHLNLPVSSFVQVSASASVMPLT